MVFFIVENIKNLWDTWNIKGLIILSLLVQSFLILFAPLRKQKGGKWIVMIPIWLAYLLADWVATFTIGLILRAEPSDILVFWAPFLLLHLGGPDNITSFSMEDNEFWIRHVLGLVLQIGSTIYVILQSFPHNKLLLPTFLVLIAGTIKYAERNRAFYLACFDHFGDNWRTHHWPMIGKHSPFGYLFYGRFPNQFLNTKFFCGDGIFAVFGIFKSLLVGPRMPSEQKGFVLSTISRSNSGEVLSLSHSREVLQNIEISLSLLYELLHTKLPVVDSKIAYFHRIANFGCVLGALLLFSILKKHYKLGEFDTWLTYGLLAGALALDLISIISLIMFPDWICFGHYENVESQKHNRRRWSKSIPQLNFITCRVKHKMILSCLPKSLLNVIQRIWSVMKRIPCVSSRDFKADQEWHFIFRELLEPVLNPMADNERGKGKEIDAKRYGGILQDNGNLNWSIKKFEYIESLLMWHIATEICYLSGPPSNYCASSTSTSGSLDHREICKLFSDYMFYLLVTEPSMIPGSSHDDILKVFQGVHSTVATKWKRPGEKVSTETFALSLDKLLDKEKMDVEMLLRKINPDMDKLVFGEMDKLMSAEQKEALMDEFSRVTAACYLARELLKHPTPWELISKV